MNLKDIREEQELTQWEVASKLKVSRSVYGMWEQGRDIIPLKRLNQFCNLFNVSMDYALGLTDRRNYPDSKIEIDREKLKTRIRNLRKENNLTQVELSSLINITRSLISKYESGKNLILTGFLLEYALKFRISIDYLVGRIDDKVPIRIKVGI